MGEFVKQVIFLKQQEMARLDPDRLEQLYQQRGETTAEDIVCRALEELAMRLTHTEGCYRKRDYNSMRKSARSMIAIAEQIGMLTLARVAADVTRCIDHQDDIALAATLSRLLRIGEGSLTEIWNMQDLSI